MNASQLQDRIYWGLNRAANILGVTTDAYRPEGRSDPLAKTNRFLKLLAAFSRADGNFGQFVGYGVPIWRGHFDAAYTRVGDYLIQTDNTWFIASQNRLQPILCVKTNRLISVTRSDAPTTGTPYGSAGPNSTATILSRWPASMLGTDARGKPPTGLPTDTFSSISTILLPSTHNKMLQPSDIITDEYGKTSVVIAAELSDLGWRLNVRQVST